MCAGFSEDPARICLPSVKLLFHDQINLCCLWTCLVYSSLHCLWTCQVYTSLCCLWTWLLYCLCCLWTCLVYTSLCCLYVSGLHQPVLPLDLVDLHLSVLSLYVSSLHQPALPLDVSGLHQPVLPLALVALLLSVLPVHVPGLNQSVLHLEVSGDKCCPLSCMACNSLSHTWKCMSIAACACKFLYTAACSAPGASVYSRLLETDTSSCSYKSSSRQTYRCSNGCCGPDPIWHGTGCY